jgi:ribosomal subunit interface protein
MTIQVHSDHNIQASEGLMNEIQKELADKLRRFEDRVTSFEVYLSDENSGKISENDKKCVIEARIKGMEPHAVTCHADHLGTAVNGAVTKIKRSLSTLLERSRSH